MCGIFAYFGQKKNAVPVVLQGLKRLEYRGYDSWGVAVKKQEDGLWVKKAVGKISQASLKHFPLSTVGLGHTRWATHGGVTKANAHPQVDCSGHIALVHNGIIENYQELRRELKNKHHFVSQTDTEILVHLIEELKEKNGFVEAVRLAFKKTQGLNAIIALDVSSNKMVAAKTGSPLIIGQGIKENFVASDLWALRPHTQKVIFLEDGQMAILTSSQVVLKEINSGKKLKLKVENIKGEKEEAVLGDYSHFMIKEISEQPRIINNLTDNNQEQIKKLASLIKHSQGTFMVGCGTAAYAALAGQYFFSKIAHFHVNPAVGSEFIYHADFLTPSSLVIALSQSGETADIIEAVKTAKKRGARVAALVNVLGSTLYRLADFKILLGAGPERCVLATKSFTAKLTILFLTAKELTGAKDGPLILKKVVSETRRLIDKKNTSLIKKIAEKIYQRNHIFVIGRGQSYPAALESALKIKEVSYIHAEGFAGGELKHGVIALVERGTPCIVFAPQDETYTDVISGAMEMKARGGMIIGVSFKNNEVFDYYLPVNSCQEATIIPNVVVAQLLGYYLALKRGYDPDKPRNLAKSVTVK